LYIISYSEALGGWKDGCSEELVFQENCSEPAEKLARNRNLGGTRVGAASREGHLGLRFIFGHRRNVSPSCE